MYIKKKGIILKLKVYWEFNFVNDLNLTGFENLSGLIPYETPAEMLVFFYA